MFENLEEGILVASPDTVHFSNHIFNDIIKGMNAIENIKDHVKDSVLDIKLFKVHRSAGMDTFSATEEHRISNNTQVKHNQ